MNINKELIEDLFIQAKENPRLRQNLDLRNSLQDNSQRMLNAMLSGTEVPIHRHPNSSENVICLCGHMVEILYEEMTEKQHVLKGFEMGMDAQNVMLKRTLREVERIHLCPSKGNYACVIPAGVWHTVEVLEPSVIYEAKDGKYGEDGSESFV